MIIELTAKAPLIHFTPKYQTSHSYREDHKRQSFLRGSIKFLQKECIKPLATLINLCQFLDTRFDESKKASSYENVLLVVMKDLKGKACLKYIISVLLK